MFYCNSCKLSVNSTHHICPLCGNVLSGEPAKKPIYPQVKPAKNSSLTALRVITFIAAVISVAVVAVNLLVPTEIWWSLFCVASLFSLWIFICIGIVKKANIIKLLSWMLFICNAVMILWDLATGWHMWSINYVFPIICSNWTLFLFVIAKALKLKDKDYIACFLLAAIVGLVPLVLMLTGSLSVLVPSVICFCISLCFILYMLLFKWKPMHREIYKKLHL